MDIDKKKVIGLVSKFDHAHQHVLTAITEGLRSLQPMLSLKPEFQRSFASGCLY